MATPATNLIRPEKQLLVCCSRTRIDEAAMEQIRRLVGPSIDWAFTLRAAAEHGVAPLLLRTLLHLHSSHRSKITCAPRPFVPWFAPLS